jgi:universal stress protein A
VSVAFPYSKILCPIDFDDSSLRGLEKAIEICNYFRAAIILVHVVPIIHVGDIGDVPAFTYDEEQKAARVRLGEIAQRKLANIEHQAVVHIGDVIGNILQAAAEFEPDVLVMATHGRTGLKHFLLGSVTEGVVRKASCPVLTFRS